MRVGLPEEGGGRSRDSAAVGEKSLPVPFQICWVMRKSPIYSFISLPNLSQHTGIFLELKMPQGSAGTKGLVFPSTLLFKVVHYKWRLFIVQQ